MIALDTNCLARLLLRDDAAQHRRVVELLGQDHEFTAPVSVMLELVWVLEVSGCSAEDVARGLSLLLDLPNFKPAQPRALRQALDWYAQDMDFADALHLAGSSGDERLVSFDKSFVKAARRVAAAPPVVLP